MTQNPFEQNLAPNPANYQPLTPLTLLSRAAGVFPKHTAVIHGQTRLDYQTFYRRCRQLASQLASRFIGPGDAVSVMLPNTPAMLEAHYGVPMTGAILHSINTRLDAAIIAFQIDHACSKVLIVDREFAPVIKQALEIAKTKPLVIDYDDKEFPQDNEPLSFLDYEEFVAGGDPEFTWRTPENEWESISLNYTSGTTGNPKGVVYHHRGAALMCYSNTVATGMGQHPVYLWTLPMFHCNGWCFPWSLSVVAGTHVCLRWVRAKAIYDAIVTHKVTHLSGAPVVMATLLDAPGSDKRDIPHRVAFNHAAAPPPQSVLKRMTEAGFDLTHLYGLTETYGPAVINEWNPDWDTLSDEDRVAKRARQGVRYVALEDLTVMDSSTMTPVKADGETMGEVMFRGNIVMKGYLKNPKATDSAFAGGWFHSGDLGVLYPDGYVQLKDRSKDIIISGGENISSIEVEDVLYKHPSVSACAVVAKPDDKWGETPCAFVELKPEANATEDEIISWCRDNLAHYKAPRCVVFTEVPKTSTGKIQKFKLREKVKEI
ncbi:MAG: acyl-CoA synthetase [Alphaproteobacteria bacterium]|nr:acyl-CoA synthetase [Alphaproteobacteria bacterium]